MNAIWTSRYQSDAVARLVKAGEIVPVRTSLGAPRMTLSYPLSEQIRPIAPHGRIFKLQGDAFDTAYLRQLGRSGVHRFQVAFESLWDRYPDRDLVLCCFENVWAGEGCHRRLFAEWWFEKTGEMIDELPETAGIDEPEPEPTQLGLLD